MAEKKNLIKPVSLGDLKNFGDVFELTKPNGDIVQVQMRAISDTELEDIRKGVNMPRLQQYPKDIYRDPKTHQVTPTYDEDKFREDNSKAQQELIYRIIALQLIIPEIEGEDLSAKAEVVRGFDSWATRGLAMISLRLQGITDQEVEMAYQNFNLPTS